MAYSYYRTITIDRTKVPNTNQTNFPVLISGTYAYLATVANGGKVQSASGYDIAFYSDAGLTTQLKHEVDKWSATTGEFVAWVKVPTVSTSADTVIYIAYGDASISSATEDPANVWDANFKGVWHLGDGSSIDLNDSTSNAANLSSFSTPAPAAAVGKIGGGVSFSGGVLRTSASAMTAVDNVTFEYWGNLPSVSGVQTSWAHGFATGIGHRMTSSGVHGYTFAGGGGTLALDPAIGAISASTWYHIVVVRNAGTTSVYKNGVVGGTTSTGTVTNNSDGWWSIGGVADASSGFSGSIDEVRMSNVARSADWIATCFNNQDSPSTFYTVGAETATGRALFREPTLSGIGSGGPFFSNPLN